MVHADTCYSKTDVDDNKGTLVTEKLVSSGKDCCTLLQSTAAANIATYKASNSICYLKHTTTAVVALPSPGLVLYAKDQYLGVLRAI